MRAKRIIFVVGLMYAEELIELLKSKDRLFHFYFNIMEDDSDSAAKAAEILQKSRKDINNELKKALVNFSRSYREVKKIVKYMERFSGKTLGE
jgi:hypothetical protein